MAVQCPAILTNEKNIRIATVVMCLIMVILALTIIIPLALSSNEAGGRCLLYSTRTGSGPDAVCGFIYSLAAIFHLCFCLARAIIIIVVLLGKLDQGWLSRVPVMVGVAVVDVVGWVMTLVAGGMVSHGFSILCSIFKPIACGELPVYIKPTNSLVRNYYSHLTIVEVSIWISCLLWIPLVVVDVFALWKKGVLQNLPIIKSLPCISNNSGSSSSSNRNRRGNTAPNPPSPAGRRVGRNRSNNQSTRSGVMLVLRREGGEDSDTDSGPRTPPPSRPPPPRPHHVPGGGAVVTPLMNA